MTRNSDPRRPRGDIAGPGGPYDRNAVVIDPTDAVLLDSTEVALVEPYRAGKKGHPILAMKLNGRINHTTEQSQILYLIDGDGAAAIISQLIGLAVRIGPEFAERLHQRLDELP